MDKELLNRYLANQVSNEEAKRVENWLSDIGNKEDILEYISASYISESNEMPVSSFEEVLNKIKTKSTIMAKVVTLKRKWFWAASAACLVFLLLGGWLGFQFNKTSDFVEDWAMNTTQTKTGQYTQVTLSDGSEVYLSGNSEIYFRNGLNVHPVVYLEGEAYFDLQSEKLTIKTRDLVTTAKNSKLNISAFLKDSLVTVTVESGKAEVRNNTNDVFPMLKLRFPKQDSVVIKPKIVPWAEIKPALTIKENEQATYDKGTKTTDVSEVKPGTVPLMKLKPAKTIREPNETTVANYLHFNKADITEIIYKLELKYGVKVTIDIEGKTLPEYSGKFDENAIISDVLNSICKALGLQYQVSENLIKITELK